MRNRSLREQIAGRCVHFTGIRNAASACEVGVLYRSVRDSSCDGPYRWPCLEMDKPCATTCEQLRWPTEAEVTAEVEMWNVACEAALKGEVAP